MGFSGEQCLPMKNRHSSTVVLHVGDAPRQPGAIANLAVFSGKLIRASLYIWGVMGFHRVTEW